MWEWVVKHRIFDIFIQFSELDLVLCDISIVLYIRTSWLASVMVSPFPSCGIMIYTSGRGFLLSERTAPLCYHVRRYPADGKQQINIYMIQDTLVWVTRTEPETPLHGIGQSPGSFCPNTTKQTHGG